MDTNTVQVIEKLGDKLDGYITTLSSKLGIAVDHFFPIFVQQQKVDAVSFVIGVIVFTIISVFLLKMGFKNVDTANEYRNPQQNSAFAKSIVGFILGGAILLVVVIATGCEFSNVIGKFMNPEYYAIESLIKMVK